MRHEVKLMIGLVVISILVTAIGLHYEHARSQWKFWRSEHTNSDGSGI
jgi:hypothetical protein